jgi:hypothetical protein
MPLRWFNYILMAAFVSGLFLGSQAKKIPENELVDRTLMQYAVLGALWPFTGGVFIGQNFFREKRVDKDQSRM